VDYAVGLRKWKVSFPLEGDVGKSRLSAVGSSVEGGCGDGGGIVGPEFGVDENCTFLSEDRFTETRRQTREKHKAHADSPCSPSE
jgi:hypothetical protein